MFHTMSGVVQGGLLTSEESRSLDSTDKYRLPATDKQNPAIASWSQIYTCQKSKPI